ATLRSHAPRLLAGPESSAHRMQTRVQELCNDLARGARVDHHFHAERLNGLPGVGSFKHALLDLAPKRLGVCRGVDLAPEPGLDTSLDRHIAPLGARPRDAQTE